jgi:dipeptidyl aminopeptidase/acylaminoacyl peptidase
MSRVIEGRRGAWLGGFLVLVSCSASAQDATSAPAITADVVYGHKDGLAMTLDVYQPADQGNGAGILFMVSGGWFSKWAPPEQTIPLFQPYLDAGYTMFAVRHGSSPRYSIPEAIADVKQAVRFVRSRAGQYQVDPDRLGATGMSAGGHLALVLGTTGDDGDPVGDGLKQYPSRVAAVVSLVPPTDLRVAVWESPESLPAYRNFPALDLAMDKAEECSPLVHVSEDDAPSLVIMGGNDELVPPKHGEWIADAFSREKVRHKLIIVPNAGHGLEGEANRRNVMREAVEWFDTCLGQTKSSDDR